MMYTRLERAQLVVLSYPITNVMSSTVMLAQVEEEVVVLPNGIEAGGPVIGNTFTGQDGSLFVWHLQDSFGSIIVLGKS